MQICFYLSCYALGVSDNSYPFIQSRDILSLHLFKYRASVFPLAPIQNSLAPPNQDFMCYNYTFNLLNISSLDAILYPLNIFFDGEQTGVHSIF